MLKVKDPQSFELLNKLVSTSGSKTFDWTKIPANSNVKSLKELEDLEIIFTRDYSEYVLLNANTKELLGKI